MLDTGFLSSVLPHRQTAALLQVGASRPFNFSVQVFGVRVRCWTNSSSEGAICVLIRFGLVHCILLLSVSAWAQQTQIPTTPPQDQAAASLQPASKDPQALSILNQALTVAGGIQAIIAIGDYTVTGSSTSPRNPDTTSSVTVSGRWPTELRTDTTLPAGVKSEIINNGLMITRAENGKPSMWPLVPPMMAGNLLLPYRELAIVSLSALFRLTYNGVIQLDGQPVYDILAECILPGGHHSGDQMQVYRTVEFYINVSTLQL